ncbi:MAG: TatD family nuclease-associated radical SAM protein [Oscillospiraceae bacterium]|nr:TatD family nuclease-associated radical SAM protein [Oscillospiraceae bacterium]
MTIFYRLGDKLYVNITNRCSCDCVFCIRKIGDSVGDADSLWLEHEPTIGEIKEAFGKVDLTGISEIVFCGYGEPLERADDVIRVGEFLKSETDLPLRLNTNGLVELIQPEFDVTRLNIFDSISISLNAGNAANYQALTRPKFGEVSFETMLNFAKKAKSFADIAFSVVEVDGFNLGECREIADKTEIPLRVRTYGM